MAQWDDATEILKSIRGVFFFGVPSLGMTYAAIQSLLPMTRGQPNEPLVQMLGEESTVLRSQCEDFAKAINRLDIKVFVYYETETSPTAQQVGRFTPCGK